MWEHLLPDVEKHAFEIDDHALRGRSVILPNGSRAAVLPQSQRAVRGLRVQKLRCDEVELFDPQIWEAAQLIVRSATLTRDDRGAAGQIDVRGSIEALSTFHKPWGMMSRLIERGIERGTRIIKWCILDVLEHCPPERVCDACLLWDECQGVAKKNCHGFFRIDDAIAHKQRVSSNTWQAEMLCRRPSTRDAVFDTFDPSVHVRDDVPAGVVKERSLAMDFGFRNPFVCLWIISFPDGTTHVIDEYVQEQRMLEEHLQHIEQRRWGKLRHVACDPAGAGRNAQTGQSDLAVLRSKGYVPRARASRILDGIEQIRFALKSATGQVRLFISPRCVRLIKALQCYHYNKDGSELPCKDGEHDHLIDALRYHFINRDRGEVKGGRAY